MPISLSRLEAFLMIIEEGALTPAARRLGVSQSTLSGTLARLEREVEQQLFDRFPTGLVLTAAGRALEPSARRAVAERNALRASIEGLQEGRAGRLTIAAMPSDTMIALFPRVLRAFAEEHPAVHCRLVPGPSLERVVAAVRRGDAAIGVVPGRATFDDVEHVHLPGLPQVLVLPPGHPRVADLAALGRLGVLSTVVALSSTAAHEAALALHGVRTAAVVSDVPSTWFPLLVLNGLGAAVMAADSAAPLEAAGCQVLPIEQLGEPITLLHRGDRADAFARRMAELAVTATSA